ncbi:hypothetical protein LLH00_06635 [bacterium]|nr:hypothetical protein [bacterium]
MNFRPFLPLLLLSVLSQPCAAQPAEDITLSARSSILNRYVWRGIAGSGKPVLQPSANLAWRGVSLDLWGNVDLNGEAGLNEVDLTLGWCGSKGAFNLEAGAIYYSFPNTGIAATTEVYLGLSHSSALSPSLRFYRDIAEVEGEYLSLGLSPRLPWGGEDSGPVFGATLGYGSGSHNRYYYGAGRAAFTDLQLSLSLPLALGENYTLTPLLGYAGLLDRRIRRAMPHDDSFIAGITFAASF